MVGEGFDVRVGVGHGVGGAGGVEKLVVVEVITEREGAGDGDIEGLGKIG